MKEEKTIIVKSEKFTYIDETNSLFVAASNPIDFSIARELLLKTKCLFDEIGLDFSLAFGTLLGAIRESSFIKGDQDVDIMIWDERLLWDKLPFLYNKGLKVVRIRKGIGYSFRIGDQWYIDVYVLNKRFISPWSLYCYYLEGKATPKKLLRSFRSIDFLGEKFLCPTKPEKILQWWYGKNWRIPQSSKGRYDVWSHMRWKNLKNRFTKKMILLYSFL